jgi:hypothetical protein
MHYSAEDRLRVPDNSACRVYTLLWRLLYHQSSVFYVYLYLVYCVTTFQNSLNDAVCGDLIAKQINVTT